MTKTRDLADLGGGFIQAGTGAVQRTVESKLQDVVSVKDFGAVGDGVTDDTVAIQAAVTQALLTSKTLYWEDKAYLTSASLSNIHGINHQGGGRILRSGATFYVQPVASNTNTLYVSTTGLAANDGLSPSQPKTIQSAFSALDNYGPVLAGSWQISVAAGTYAATSIAFPSGLDSQKPVLIYGPSVGGHPNVPTAIFSRASQATSGFLFATSKAIVRDIKFEKFNSNSSSYAVAVRDQGQLYTDNVHVNDAYLGIVGNGQCELSVVGGIIENCAEGIRSLFNCYHSIGAGTAVDTSLGPIIKTCDVGFSARESSTGHADFVTFESNTFGLSSEVNARVNCSGSDFKRNTVAIRMRGGNVLRTGCNFNLGSVDANTENLRLVSFGQDFTADQNCLSSRVRYRDVTTAGSITGTTTETVMYTYSLEAGAYQTIAGSTYVGKCIRVIARGSATGTAGNKTLRVRFGGLVGTAMNALVTAAAGRWEYVVEIFVRGNADQRVNGRLIQDGNIVELGAGTISYNLANALPTDLVVTGTTANASDLISFDYFAIEVEG